MRILIVDDESLARVRLRGLIHEIGIGEIVGELSNGKEILNIVEHQHTDVILLDIRMPGIDGMKIATMLSQLPMPPAIIFTTAYKDHALEAFEKQAVDYLLKPIRKARLEMALQRADLFLKNRVEPSTLEQNVKARSHITINTKGELQLIPVKDIYYFSAEEKYVILHWKKGEVLLTDTLKALQEEFAGQFLRIHRSTLVAVTFIKSLTKDKQGHCYINLREVKNSLEVSRRHLPIVRKMLKDMRLPTV